MENKTKPRICEVLGVEIGRPFKAVTPHMMYDHLEVNQEGVVWDMGKSRPYKVGPRSLCYMINHPESIHKTPCWTPKEVELAKAIKLVLPNVYRLYCLSGSTGNWIRSLREDGNSLTITFKADRFPSLKPGETVLISEIIGGDENA